MYAFFGIAFAGWILYKFIKPPVITEFDPSPVLGMVKRLNKRYAQMEQKINA